MSTIMVLGIGPVTFASREKFHSGGNRAWHLSKPLIDNGYDVVLVCMRITDPSANDQPLETTHHEPGLTYYEVDEVKCFADDNFLKEKITKHKPVAIIGACDYPASRAVQVAGDLPVWADVHGYPMGEAQAKAWHYNEPGYLHHFWNVHRPVLQRADRFSVTSERQRMALIGELGCMGRLNNHTFMEPLVSQIPIAWDPETPFTERNRGRDEPLVVFFSGGYNLWCDIETLFNGLETAMFADERIRFLSTGGAISGHDDHTYPRFEKMVQGSRFRERFDLRGWVARSELIECQKQAHLGINVDLPCYETLIGARNRITEFTALGIPVLTTLGSEISQILFYKNIALTVPMQSPDTLANEILLAADHPVRMREMAKEARELFEHDYTFHKTVLPLLDWCDNPVRSGDYGKDPVLLDYRHPTHDAAPARMRPIWKRLFNLGK